MMISAQLLERFRKTIDRDDVVALLQAAVSRQSITGNEANFVDFLEERMIDLRLDPERADFLPGRPNIWGGRKGSGGGKRLLFIGHTDTVHVSGWEERWKGSEREDPFGGAVVDGEIWGRGTGDLKAGICSALAALQLVDKSGLKLQGDVAFAFVGDEESGEPGTGVSAGVKDYTRRVVAGEIERPDFAVYVEPTRLSVFPAQMGFFIADVKITGKSAYFGVPEVGVDALKAAHAVLAAIWDHSQAISTRAEHPLVGRAFALVTEINGGGYIAVPGECSLSLIRKLLPEENLDDAVAELEAAIRGVNLEDGIAIELDYPAGRDHRLGGSPAEVAADLQQIISLADALDAAMPGRGRIEGAPYWSEVPFLIDQIGCPAVYCAPGDITNCHTLEERVNIEEYVAGVVAFAAFIANHCGVVEA
ncbi:MAG: M20 family metallopeptidase [Hyphomicrobiales bacterium]|nr:M20 family metallopeptidase [Hyphomicrobiales bacterium]MCP5002170.1 M20 family metallopeptidase [Hyphomicrobiales bacterium]